MTLVLRDISVVLAGRRVVAGVDVRLAPGEVLGVIGPNGAGKSTLLRTAAGLATPATGAVMLDGRPIRAWDRRALARELAFLPQERSVHWPLTVRAVTALGRLPHRGFAAAPSASDAAAVDRAMAAADVAELADRPVTALSGGERARALLARALAQDAAILVADEPAAGLDPAHQLDLFQRFAAMAAEGRSVMVALHDLALAARFCHRLLLLEKGRPVALDRPAAVLTAANIAAVYGVSAHLATIDGVPIVTPLSRLT